MSGYTKLFSSILASTIWEEDKDTRIVWITLLAMANRRGIAEGSVPGLATFARLSLDETRNALIKLSSPDPDSRSREEDGRRILVVEGGWFIVNHKKYREKLNEDERREYQAAWQAQHRAKQTGANTVPVDNVDSVDKISTVLTQAAPDTNTISNSKVPDADAPGAFEDFWLVYPNKAGKKAALKAWRALKPSVELRACILVDLVQRSRAPAWMKDDGAFVPHASTYLQGARWNDPLQPCVEIFPQSRTSLRD